MMLIGITGPAGAGKDTAADFLVRFGYIKMAFAGPLKAMLAAGGFPEPADRALKETQIDGFDFSWRQAAQRLGTEFGRGLDPNIWTKMVRRDIELLCSCNSDINIVLSDVRFENEAAMIREMGGVIIKLGGRTADLGENASHVSENGVSLHPADIVINNIGTIEYLHDALAVHFLGKE